MIDVGCIRARSQYERLNERYASDVTDDEYRLIAPFLPRARHGGRRRTTDLREVLNAVLYLVRTGCQWRMLPKDFPPWTRSTAIFDASGKRGYGTGYGSPLDAGA